MTPAVPRSHNLAHLPRGCSTGHASARAKLDSPLRFANNPHRAAQGNRSLMIRIAAGQHTGSPYPWSQSSSAAIKSP